MEAGFSNLWLPTSNFQMKYIKLVIAIADEYQETFITELLELDFDAFEQQDNIIITYIPQQSFNDAHRERIEQILAVYPGKGYIKTEEVVADQNWNEEWEKTIQAQQIGSFFVKPTWSSEIKPEGTILLEIDPKMAFGTGYHETTRLILKQLPEIISEGATVLDAGTGTGILAIAAVKLGAQEVLAFDIDEWSVTNSKENIYLNDVADYISIKKGSVEVIPQDQKFDVVLANIERNPILQMMDALNKAMNSGGFMLLSGLQRKDQSVISKKAEELNLSVNKVSTENEWIAVLLS